MATEGRPIRGHELTPPETRPAGLCEGLGHVLAYGNPACLALVGPWAVGMPLREVLVGWPADAFQLLDRVYRDGRPLARWIELDGEDWRLTAVPRRDPATEAVDGIAFHLRARWDPLVST